MKGDLKDVSVLDGLTLQRKRVESVGAMDLQCMLVQACCTETPVCIVFANQWAANGEKVDA